ncbi:MAG: mechanosensitive ion channel [Flavobacteriaceae bacterium]|jgi:small-conductance mechanosensitive channel|nr:mechanosensitive ion channel [Flavobacteriaceae bacterium]MDG1028836.1 mechanosensitive ion channel [Flavobacteriaceae bacterium]MDG1942291.1 mechanosensitive ion channel [Flavobacteriaceae bacterium]
MQKLVDFFNYQIRIGSDIVLTPKSILIILLVFFLTYLFLKLFRRVVFRTLNNDTKLKFKGILTFFNYLIYLIVILITLDNVGVKVSAIFAASAALLVGIGLALQTLIQDVFSGVSILADKTVHVGDVIQVDGQVGRVENITLRTTRAVTRDNKVLIIPNHKFLTSILYNWTENGVLTKETIQFGVAYKTDVNLLKEAIIEITNSHPKVLKNPAPFLLFEDFGDSALMFQLFFSMNKSFEANIVKSDLRFKIFERLKVLNIEIPFPQRVVTFKNDIPKTNEENLID